jgi:hypothetical protein
MTRSAKTRVLYLGAGAPHAAANGMDVVSRTHIEELLGSACLDVAGLVVSSALGGRQDNKLRISIGGVSIIVGDPIAGVSRLRVSVRKLTYAVTGCGAMIAFSFRSSEARAFICRALASSDYDVVVIDHFATLANIPILHLLTSRMPIVYIAHDVTPVQIRDTGRLKRRRSATFLFAMEAAKARFFERLLLKLSRVAIFLSSYDRSCYGLQAMHAETLLPVRRTTDPQPAGRKTDRTLLFVGSPRFRPNEFAIDWLVEEFAPVLFRRDPSVRILLAGSGTEFVKANSANVGGLGFVPDRDLDHLMDASAGVVCPIIHGSGIKIKVLQAIARGCLVFATEEALRGLDEFALEPLLEIKDPRGSADRIIPIVIDPARASGCRALLVGKYLEYCRRRDGRLATILRTLDGQA